MGPRPRRAAINLARQAVSIRRYCDDFSHSIRWGKLTATATIQPTSLTERYSFRLEYKIGKTPKIWILNPKLRRRDDDEPIPHTYGPQRPCVFYPQTDWSSSELLGLTVIPWLAEWLFFYEVWHATGQWLGGGIHPTIRDEGQVAYVTN